MEQPQQRPVRVLVQHPPVERRLLVLVIGGARNFTLDAVDEGVDVPQQGRQLQQQEHDTHHPMEHRRPAQRRVVVVDNVPEKLG